MITLCIYSQKTELFLLLTDYCYSISVPNISGNHITNKILQRISRPKGINKSKEENRWK